MTEVSINGHNYRINKMGAFDQLEAVSLLAPIIEAMSQNATNPIMKAISELGRQPRSAKNSIFNLALKPVLRQNGKDWTALIAFDETRLEESPQLMFDSTEGYEVAQLVYKSVEHSLSNFLPANLTEESPSPVQESA